MDQNKNLCERNHIAKTTLYNRWAPKQLEAFALFAKTSFEDGKLSHKEKELIAIGCAHVLQCPYCIDYHVQLAETAGANAEEIAEATWVGIFVASSASYEFAEVTTGILKSGNEENHYLDGDSNKKFDQLRDACLEEGTLNHSFKLLIAIGCSHNIFSQASAEQYMRSALEAGQSRGAISETIWVAIEMAAGACFGHSGLTADLLDENP